MNENETTEMPQDSELPQAESSATIAVAEAQPLQAPKKRLEPTSKHIVGFWHYGVILTYLSLALSVCGICFAAAYGGPRRDDMTAFFLLMSALCDAFDGMVAKTRKNRTENDKLFGMNIDSLSDMVSFGIAPVMVGVAMGLTRWYYVFFYVFYVLCALVRLAYYDVSEVNRLKDPNAGRRNSYEGLPVTNSAFVVVLFYLVASMFDNGAFASSIGLSSQDVLIYKSVIMMVCYVLLGLLFVIKFKMFKARAKGLAITISIVTVLVIALALVRWYVCGVPLFVPFTKFSV